MKKPREVTRLGSNMDSEEVVLKSREVGRFARLLFHIFKFWRVREKNQEGREVRFESRFRRGRLKIKGGREVRSFVGSYLQILESA